ncbi:organic anion transporter 3-like isoform X2 [Ornithodoros turicata]|uniref:organic anion transporter 3-like isoform X2 n=1 Tax=Ornithodoros turicata TaxID=34597 RepID=UPI00313A3A2A
MEEAPQQLPQAGEAGELQPDADNPEQPQQPPQPAPRRRRRGRQWNMLFLYDVLVFVVTTLHNLMPVVAAPDVDHWCHQPEEDLVLTVEEWKNMSIPRRWDGSYDRCFMYRNITADDQRLIPCTTWDFDNYYTIVSEWNLVCDRKVLLSLALSVYVLGSVIGTLMAGIASDKIGRRPVVCCLVVVLEVCGLAVYSTNDFNTFTALRFFVGFGCMGVYSITYVLSEVVGHEQRSGYIINVQYGFAVGITMVNLMGDLALDWRSYQLTAMMPTAVLVIGFLVVPESPRWLEMQVAHKAERAAAKFDVEAQRRRRKRKLFLSTRLRLLMSKELRFVSIALYFTWATCTTTFYMLTFSEEVPTGMRAIYTIFTGLLPILTSAITVEWIGRKITIVAALTVASVPLMLMALMSQLKLTGRISAGFYTGLTLTAQNTVLIAYASILLYTVELYPTDVRCIGFCLTVIIGRAAITLIPFVQLGSRAVQYVLIGSTCLFCILLLSPLPETRAVALPDAESRGDILKKKKKKKTQKGARAKQGSDIGSHGGVPGVLSPHLSDVEGSMERHVEKHHAKQKGHKSPHHHHHEKNASKGILSPQKAS